MLSPECVLTVGFWSKYYLKALFPVGMVGLVLGVDSIKENRKLKQSRCTFIFSNRAHFLVAFIGLALFTPSVSNAFSPFNCVSKSDGLLVLAREPSVVCFDQKWFVNIPFVIFFLMLYPLMTPLAIAIVFLTNRSNKDSPEFLENWGFLVAPYRHSVFWWELVLLMKRTVFAIGVEFLGSNSAWKIILTALILFAFVIAETLLQPYRGSFRNLVNIR
jgi:hypothetical protein